MSTPGTVFSFQEIQQCNWRGKVCPRTPGTSLIVPLFDNSDKNIIFFRALFIVSAICLALPLVDGDEMNPNNDDTGEDAVDIDEVDEVGAEHD